MKRMKRKKRRIKRGKRGKQFNTRLHESSLAYFGP